MTRVHDKTCPDAAELLDHVEGRVDRTAHLAHCPACARATRELGLVVEVEARSIAPPSPIEVERALGRVLGRARAARRYGWLRTAAVSLGAAAAVLMLLPAALESSRVPSGPMGIGGTPAAALSPPRDIPVELHREGLSAQERDLVERISGATGPLGSAATVHSEGMGLRRK
jgi:hypothetical protein